VTQEGYGNSTRKRRQHNETHNQDGAREGQRGQENKTEEVKMRWMYGLIAIIALSMVMAVDTDPPEISCYITDFELSCGESVKIYCNITDANLSHTKVGISYEPPQYIPVEEPFFNGVTYEREWFTEGLNNVSHQFWMWANDTSGNELNYTSPSLIFTEMCSCVENWQPLDWTECSELDFTQTRTYVDMNACGTFVSQPEDDSRSCAISTFTYGDSTDFTQVADPTNVSGAVVESYYGKIAWTYPIDVAGYDLDENIIVSDNAISVNVKDLDPSLNTTAEITARMVTGGCDQFKLWYAPTAFSDENGLLQAIIAAERRGDTEFFWFDDINQKTLKVKKMADKQRIGMDCTDASVCKDVRCSADTLQFEAQHFSGFVFGGEYTSDDISEAVIDGVGRFIITIVGFAGVIAVVVIGSWAISNFRKK
jgi:hypothetical protein